MQETKSRINVCESFTSSSKLKTLNFAFFCLAVYGAVTATVLLVLWINGAHDINHLLQIEKENSQQEPGLASFNENQPFKNNRVKRSDDKHDSVRHRRRKKVKRKPTSRKDADRGMASAIHLQIDSTFSQPNSPELKTGAKGEVINYWKLARDHDFSYKQTFATYSGGNVTIKKKGLYLIYTQITYYDRTGRWSHLVDISGKPFVKCIGSEWGIETDPETGKHYNTVHQCYSSAVTLLKKGDIVSIKSMYAERVIHVDTELTFWGIIKLSN